MSDRLPVHIDPVRLAQQGRAFVGRIPISSLNRLAGLLLSDQGDIEVSLNFYRDERGRHCLNGELRANLQLECQRCLEAMNLVIDDGFELVLVESEAEAEIHGEDDEILIVESTPMVLNDIIEDELMLLLPQVAMHDEAECKMTTHQYGNTGSAEGQQGAEEAPNPFAALAELKRKDD